MKTRLEISQRFEAPGQNTDSEIEQIWPKASKPGKTRQLLATTFLTVSLLAGAAAMAPAAAQQVTPAEQVQAPAQDAETVDSKVAEAKTAMMADPALALEHANRAENLLLSSPQGENHAVKLATVLWLKSEALTRTGQSEAGGMVAGRALDLIEDQENPTKLTGDLLLARARAAIVQGNLNTAVRSFFDAHEVFVAIDEPRSQSMTLQNIGSLHWDAGAHDKALEYFQRAEDAYAGDPNLNLSLHNNRALALRSLKRYPEAVDSFQASADIAQGMGSDLLEGRIVTNLAETYAQMGNLARSEETADRAATLLAGEGSEEWARFVTGVRAHIAYQRGELEAARALFERVFEGKDLQSTTLHFRDLHKYAADTYQARGDYEQAYAHERAYHRISDNAQSVSTSANLALAAVEFDFVSQNVRIAQLEEAQQSQNANLRNVMIIAGICALAALLFGFGVVNFLLMRRRERKLGESSEKLKEAESLLHGDRTDNGRETSA